MARPELEPVHYFATVKWVLDAQIAAGKRDVWNELGQLPTLPVIWSSERWRQAHKQGMAMLMEAADDLAVAKAQGVDLGTAEQVINHLLQLSWQATEACSAGGKKTGQRRVQRMKEQAQKRAAKIVRGD